MCQIIMGRVDENMSNHTDQTLDTLKAHIDAIVDGSIVITVNEGKITLIDSINDRAANREKVQT